MRRLFQLKYISNKLEKPTKNETYLCTGGLWSFDWCQGILTDLFVDDFQYNIHYFSNNGVLVWVQNDLTNAAEGTLLLKAGRRGVSSDKRI